ncbi:alpha-D-glucose phosphate-specific phosphoglucomutase [uncultured Abyssibacter sp.]|uniref:alpha-D-glucose phosphate-specific phosphoglucomutase n=1 Tax=uncultured Abyssibacter sp. TaxID=2320202 RepID=UPI0032B1A5E1
MSAAVRTITTTPFDDQRVGTAGLRKKVRVFQQTHYLENFVQAVFDTHPGFEGSTLVVGGDGRYHNDTAIQTILAMAAANGVAKIIVGKGGILSTPAASHLIRKYDAHGGFILSASHNPAGPDGDFGIKFSIHGGGQASSALTDAIYARSQEIDRYRLLDAAPVPLDDVGAATLGDMTVDVIDSTEDYADLMESLFDFDAIRALLASDFRFAFDAMHAVTGPYATRLFVERLGASPDSVRNAEPLPDFGGGHPDPNLVYAADLADEAINQQALDFAAASDGDGDRNMILGRGVFVSPGDSLAVIAANASTIPVYADGIPGAARSMPTSRALDAVAAQQGFDAYETPTGWKFFCNLLDAGRIAICGEESFGTGSDHVREKDGLWAVLAWLNLLAARRGESLAEILLAHWKTYGRHYYERHDYEDLSAEQADAVMQSLRAQLAELPGRTLNDLTITAADEFGYTDPIDGSSADGQGLRVIFGDAARIVLRKSGTGTSGATLRLYLEELRSDEWELRLPTHEVLGPLSAVADSLCQLREQTGRDKPSLVT